MIIASQTAFNTISPDERVISCFQIFEKMRLKTILCAISVLLVASPCLGYRILGLFTHAGVSHFNFARPILKALGQAGHNVTVYGHFPDPDYTLISVVEGIGSLTTMDLNVSSVNVNLL